MLLKIFYNMFNYIINLLLSIISQLKNQIHHLRINLQIFRLFRLPLQFVDNWSKFLSLHIQLLLKTHQIINKLLVHHLNNLPKFSYLIHHYRKKNPFPLPLFSNIHPQPLQKKVVNSIPSLLPNKLQNKLQIHRINNHLILNHLSNQYKLNYNKMNNIETQLKEIKKYIL
jgi:hypothetical protein